MLNSVLKVKSRKAVWVQDGLSVSVVDPHDGQADTELQLPVTAWHLGRVSYRLWLDQEQIQTGNLKYIF